MLPVSKEFHTAMTADTRRTFGRVHIDYSHPNVGSSVVFGDWPNLIFFFLTPQVADGVTVPTRRWASCDMSTRADGNSFPMPWSSTGPDQVGWWGLQMADQEGAFVPPFPTITTHTNPPCPYDSLRVVGDSVRGEFPVDFVIRLLDAGRGALHTHTVTGNTLVDWQTAIPLVLDVRFAELEIRRWSHPIRQAKIVEFFSPIQETYEGDSLISFNLIEEREVSQGSLPVGIISANEINIKLDNSDRRFDAGNRGSRLYGLLRQNRRIRAWLGMKGDGSGVNMQQAVDFNTGVRNNLVVNAGRLELPVVGSAAFTRNSTAHLRNGTLVNTNLPRFETGRFGQGVMVEEGTTNLISPPRPPRFSSASRPPTIQWDIANNFRISGTDGPGGQLAFLVQPTNLASADITAFTLRIENPVNAFLWVIQLIDVNGAAITTGAPPAMGTFNVYYNGWFRIDLAGVVQLTFSGLPAGVRGIGFGVRSSVSSGGQVCSVDRLQIEARSYATSFIDGTRAAERLTIPTAGILSPAEGTVEFWWQPINQPASNMTTQLTSPQIMRMGTYANDNSWVLWNLNGTLSLLVRGAGHTSWTGFWQVISSSLWHQLNRWYHISVRWSGTNTFWVFVDGVRYGPYVSTHPFTGVAGNVMALGGAAVSGSTNAFIDDLRISNRARTDQEIADAFNSGQPLPVDADTTYALRMDGDLNYGQGGDYTSPEYDLSIVGTGITSGIHWQAPVDGVTRDVSARLDGQAWTPVTNGGALPFSPGQLLTGRRLQLHALMRRG